MDFAISIKNPQTMRRWGRRLARYLKPGNIVALVGELGTGKTTLVQGIASGWGYDRDANSPTFALVNEYQTPQGMLFHMDMYRLSPKELDAFPLEDYFDRKALCCVEWADRVRERWPAGTLEIHLETEGEDQRTLRIADTHVSWLKKLSNAN